MKTQLLSIAVAMMFTVTSFAQQQIPNGGFETWHTEGQGEDPDNWGSLFNQFNSNYVLTSKTTDANSGTNALKLVCDTGSVFWIPSDTIYGSVNLGLVNAQVSNAKVPFTSQPDSLTGYMKGTVINGGFYMNMTLYKAGANIATATYFFVTTKTNYTRFSVPVNYSQSVTPDTMTFTIIAAHPGLNPSADPSNVFFVDDLTLIYNPNGINDVSHNSNTFIFPNPASEQITFVQSGNQQSSVKIIDVLGNTVKQIALKDETTKTDVSELMEGIYFYQVSNKNGNTLSGGKFIKK